MDIKKTIENLEKNNMTVYLVKNKEAAKQQAEKLLTDGETVSVGGSVTINETGIMDLLKCGKYNFLDRNREGITPEEIGEIYRKTFFCDTYFTSSNAITENGELYNADGNANRVSAMLFGPKSVVVVCGINKIVKNIDEAAKRVKTIAAPENCERLKLDNYCRFNGRCVSLDRNGDFCDGCDSETRICRNFVVMSSQKIKGRIKIILVEEALGY